MTLRDLRKEKELSTREVARRIGVSQPAIVKLEKKGSCRVAVLENYAQALGVEFEEVRQAAQQTREISAGDNQL